MKKLGWLFFCFCLSLYLSGCTKLAMRGSTSREPRVDQTITGNRGFIAGKPSSAPKEPAFKDRKVYRVEIELPGIAPRTKTVSKRGSREDAEIWGNQGYIFSKNAQGQEPATWAFKGQPLEEISYDEPQTAGPEVKQESQTRRYKVVKGDTLQKIAQKFYGTTKKWLQIYQANQDKLKSPDRLFPGQELIIPDIQEFKK